MLPVNAVLPVTPLFAEAAAEPSWGNVFVHGFVTDLLPFLGIAGLLFLVCYVFLPRALASRKIQTAFPGSAEVRREFLLSVQSIAVFAGVGVLFYELSLLGWTQLYFRIDTFGWPYFVASVLLLIAIQDGWFYWTHRLLHWAPVFRRIHYVHHRCHNPTPWGAFAFHPVEAFLNVLIFPLVLICIPIHPVAAEIWLFYMFFMTAMGHLGFELLPRGYTRHWMTRWSTTATHHNLHHTEINTNYGLYFTLWDNLMGTTHRRYDETFEEVAGGRKKTRRAARRARRDLARSA
jgi:sterol desaturase/sphingolipid hydroxylase (fatty acid hydroxylase superfamily)